MADQLKISPSKFRALQIINEERSTYGLRYGDYTRYRKHCAHKTHRLRSSLKLTHGKGREFKKLPPIAPESARDAHLQLLLFETERAWAHAQELSAPQEARRSTARYRRSHCYLSRLLKLARSPDLVASPSCQSVIELFVYALIHTARLNLRRPSSSTAAFYGLEQSAGTDKTETQSADTAHPLVQLSVAYALLDELEKTARTSKDVALARAFKDDIGPEIRWCVHEFNRRSDVEDEEHGELAKYVLTWKKSEWDIEGIVGGIAPEYAERVVGGFNGLVHALKREASVGDSPVGKKEILEELVWDGAPVPVRNPEMVDVLLKVQEAIAKLRLDGSTEAAGVKLQVKGAKGKAARGRLSKYDGVLLTLSDAVDQARKLVDAQQVSGFSSNMVASAGNRDIHFMHGFVTYLHLTYRIERDLILLTALSDGSAGTAPQNMASILHLLSGVLQSLSQTLTLSIADETPDLSTALSLRLSHAKATRALYLARVYSDQTHRRYAEAVLLTQRGQLHVREARSMLSILPADSSCPPQLQFYPLDAKVLDDLDGQLTRDEERYKIEWFGYSGGVVEAAGALGTSQQHKKPLFFDIAFNYVEPPMDRLRVRAGLPPRVDEGGGVKTREEKEEELEEEEGLAKTAPVSRGGLAGLLGSWWGRR